MEASSNERIRRMANIYERITNVGVMHSTQISASRDGLLSPHWHWCAKEYLEADIEFCYGEKNID